MAEATAEPEVIPSDAGDTEVPNAAPETTPEVVESAPNYEADYEAYLEENKGKEGEPEPTPGAERETIDPELIRRQIETYRRNHETRQKDIDGLKGRLMEEGLSSAAADFFIKEVKDRLNSHHADGLSYAGAEAAAKALQNEHQDITSGLTKGLPAAIKKAVDTRLSEVAKANPNGAVPYADLFQAIHDEAEKAGVAKGKKEGFIAGRSFAGRQKSISNGGKDVQGSEPAPNSREAEDAALLDPNTPIEKVTAILARRNGQ